MSNYTIPTIFKFGRFLLAVWFGSVSVACLAQSPTPPDAAEMTKSEPAAYLNRALDEMQAHALRRATVDWPRVRGRALALAVHAESTVDTYAAIRFALSSLGDHHSSLHLSPALEKLEAQRRTQNSSTPQPDQQPTAFGPYVGRYGPEGRMEKIGNRTFALVVVTKCFPDNDQQFVAFETKLQRIVADLDGSHPAGWIVDLRGNVGGNMWPMLAGIGPLLGEGDHLGEFFDSEDHSIWGYRNGVAEELENGKVSPYPAVEGTPYKVSGTPNVAVLIDRGTGSSGEAIAVAFRGRPHTRLFGEHTEGVSTVNETFALSDGASLWLTIGVQADRAGKQYPDGLAPDEAVRPSDKPVADEQDPVLQAALRWLTISRTTETQ